MTITDTYIQPVPDKCDRIIWRNKYYQLPLHTQASPPSAEPAGWEELVVSAISRMRAAHVPCNDLVSSAEALLFAALIPKTGE